TNSIADAYAREMPQLPEDEGPPPDLEDLISKEDAQKLFINPRPIGEGAVGTVYVATDVRTNTQVALKKLKVNDKTTKFIVGEISMMQKNAQHPNIVKYIASYKVKSDLWVVMEYMDAGTLTEILDLYEKHPESCLT